MLLSGSVTLSYLGDHLPIFVPGFLPVRAKFLAYKGPFFLGLLKPRGISYAQAW